MHVTVVPLSPERRVDYLAFFDGAAFADNFNAAQIRPGCAGEN